MLTILAGLSLLAWLYLLLARGFFWRIVSLDTARFPAARPWPEVAAIIPARNEAGLIGGAVRSLLDQRYPGQLMIVVIDDHSDDGTAAVAAETARSVGRGEDVRVIAARPLPDGWTGKLWALSEGVHEAERGLPTASYLWFTDADIEHGPEVLRFLAARAVAEDLDLASLMVELPGRGIAEQLLLAPFVFFFRKLYPFAWVNDPRRRTAAAAGGCLLVRPQALARAGGLAPIAGALIDDCALASLIKAKGRPGGGRIWLGLTRAAHSRRDYGGIKGIWRMVARSAYTQLGHSPLLLVGTLAAMLVAYLVPPLVVLAWPVHGQLGAGLIGLAAWLVMSATIWPTLRYYGQSTALAPLLPIAACLYCAMTLDSALAHMRGRGGAWKGRTGTHLAGAED